MRKVLEKYNEGIKLGYCGKWTDVSGKAHQLLILNIFNSLVLIWMIIGLFLLCFCGVQNCKYLVLFTSFYARNPKVNFARFFGHSE